VTAAAVGAGAHPNVRRSVFRSSTAQMAARVVLALSRLFVAALIVRAFGPERYGEYSLVLVLTAVPEWIVDFGSNDIFVRELSRHPGRRELLLKALTATKVVQVAAAYAVLVALLLVMRYPAPILRASLIAGLVLFLHAGILVYRALFKANLTLEWDVLGEVAGVLTMVPFLWAACRLQAPLEVLALCHVGSRCVYLGVALALGSRTFRLSLRGVSWPDVRLGLRQSAAIGVAGLVVGVYEMLDALVLSKASPPAQLGYYSAAQKLLWPLIAVLGSVGTALFPVLSSTFGSQPERFRRYLQGGLEAVMLLSAFLLSGVAAGADFALGLLGGSMLPAGDVLRVLALACFAKAITTTLGPVLYVTGSQAYALWVIGAGTLVKAGLLLVVVPRYGALGAALSLLAVEVLVGLAPTVLLVQHFTRCRLDWTPALRVILALLPAHAIPWALGMRGSFTAGVLCGALFLAGALLTGALKPREWRDLMPRPFTPGGVAPTPGAS
jgi:O-antigen/teichoic acid export membrane protein